MPKARPAQRVVTRAVKYIGQHEEGRNDGPFVRRCFEHTWLLFKNIREGEAYWCVAFIMLVFDEEGIPFPWKTAGAFDLFARAQVAGWTGVLTPKPGDVAIWNIGDGHGSIVEKYDAQAKAVYTVDGNVGDQVKRCVRPISQARGFVRHEALRTVKKPAKPTRAPLYEILSSASGHSTVVYRSTWAKAIVWLTGKKWAGPFTIRRAK